MYGNILERSVVINKLGVLELLQELGLQTFNESTKDYPEFVVEEGIIFGTKVQNVSENAIRVSVQFVRDLVRIKKAHIEYGDQLC